MAKPRSLHLDAPVNRQKSFGPWRKGTAVDIMQVQQQHEHVLTAADGTGLLIDSMWKDLNTRSDRDRSDTLKMDESQKTDITCLNYSEDKYCTCQNGRILMSAFENFSLPHTIFPHSYVASFFSKLSNISNLVLKHSTSTFKLYTHFLYSIPILNHPCLLQRKEKQQTPLH